jgi:hypothetical protein
MTTNEIGTVIGMVCDKVGLAVDKVQPLAEEVVRQYQARAMAWMIVCATLFVIGIPLIIFCLKRVSNHEDGGEVQDILTAVIAVAVLLNAGVAFCANIGDYFAPLCGLIGK